MKLLLIGLRLIALGILFSLFGCGSSNGKSSGSGLYTLRFTWTNTGTTPIRFEARDLDQAVNINAFEIVPAGGTAVTRMDGGYTSPSTKILVRIVNLADGTEITHIEQPGVHVSEDKTTYIYADSNGLRLNLQAGNQAGVP